MAQCGMIGCDEKAIAGFLITGPKPPGANPNGDFISFCDAHEHQIRPDIYKYTGRWLTPEELESLWQRAHGQRSSV